jgi:hypothetical protein
MWEVVSKMALRKMEGPAIPRWMQRVPLRQAGMPGNISSPTRDLAVCGGCHREVQRPKIAIFRDKNKPRLSTARCASEFVDIRFSPFEQDGTALPFVRPSLAEGTRS